MDKHGRLKGCCATNDTKKSTIDIEELIRHPQCLSLYIFYSEYAPLFIVWTPVTVLLLFRVSLSKIYLCGWIHTTVRCTPVPAVSCMDTTIHVRSGPFDMCSIAPTTTVRLATRTISTAALSCGVTISGNSNSGGKYIHLHMQRKPNQTACLEGLLFSGSTYIVYIDWHNEG